MSKKNIVMAVSGLAIILVLAVLYGVVSFMSDNPGENTENPGGNITETKTEKVFRTNSHDKLSSVLLSKGDETEYFIRKDTLVDSFLIDGLERHNYSTAFTNVISSVTGLTITGNVENPLDESEYGLSLQDNPYILTVTGLDGTTETVYIGSKLLSGDGYYCKRQGEEKIFTIGNAANSFLKDKYSLISPLLAKQLDSSRYHYTESFRVYKNNKKLVEITYVPESEQDKYDAYGYYRMVYPTDGYSVSDISYDNALKLLISPQADTVITTELTNENLIKYGFMESNGTPLPSYEINYTLDNEKRTLYFGKRTEDGLIYVMSPDTNFIGIAGVESHFPFIDWELIDYVNPALFGMNINHLSKLTVQGNDVFSIYTLEGEGGSLVVRNALGTQIDTKNFRSFYRVLLMASMDGYAENTNTDDWMLTFKIERRDGKITEYKFYRISNLKCYYTVNDIGEFYVSLDDVEKILSDAKKLASGEEIDADARV